VLEFLLMGRIGVFTSPNTSWGVIGHDWAVRSLYRSVASNSVSHAYLLTGPPGVGKTTLARSLAAALLCQRGQGSPCGECRACRLIDSGNHPDLHIVESGREGGSLKIQQVRDLQSQLCLTPIEARWRVAILRRFEEATASAANGLLKTLEEPPPYAVLIVLSSDADRLLPTIVSRCRQIPLRPLPVSSVRQALVERWDTEPEQAELLAHLSGGRLGWAVSVLGDSGVLQRRDHRLDDLDNLLKASITDRFGYAARLVHSPVAMQETLDLWITWWRDVMMLASGANTSLANVDRHQKLLKYAERFTVEQSASVVRALCRASERLGRNANSRLTLEVLMLDLPHL
jgi:DNA polymerase-3 subunit delta'